MDSNRVPRPLRLLQKLGESGIGEEANCVHSGTDLRIVEPVDAPAMCRRYCKALWDVSRAGNPCGDGFVGKGGRVGLQPKV